jgi:CheY-like chemotaxis protein
MVGLPASLGGDTDPLAAVVEVGPAAVLQSQPVTILVVEEDPCLRTVLRELLQDEGYGVIMAADGRHGLELAQQHRPRAILLDLSRPVTSVWDMLRQLRAGDQTRHVPVIALNGWSELAFDADGQPPDVLMAKPFDLTVLLDHLARVVQEATRAGVWVTQDHGGG